MYKTFLSEHLQIVLRKCIQVYGKFASHDGKMTRLEEMYAKEILAYA